MCSYTRRMRRECSEWLTKAVNANARHSFAPLTAPGSLSRTLEKSLLIQMDESAEGRNRLLIFALHCYKHSQRSVSAPLFLFISN